MADLQDAPQACLDRGALLLVANPTARQEFTIRLKPERAAQAYGGTTVKPVGANRENSNGYEKPNLGG